MKEYITVEQYFGHKISDPSVTPEVLANAAEWCRRNNVMLNDYVTDGGVMTIDPDTGTYISGAKGGNGDGGFRLPDSPTGVPSSTHKKGNGGDISDQQDMLDAWLNRDRLVKYGLWRETPKATKTWCHTQIVPPKSGLRTYSP